MTLSRPFEEVQIHSSHHHTRLEMIGVSCPDRTQSEAYVATVGLFGVSQSSKEEKVYMRLPPVWRDLWEEMRKIQKERKDTSGRESLRQLRLMIAENDSSEMKTDQGKGAMDLNDTNGVIPTADNARAFASSPDVLRRIWADKVSSPSYNAMLNSRMNLPIAQYQRSILDAINSNQVVIVCGATGCGKSTQVPAYVLEDELSKGNACKVYCTEPRRISAISLAHRVSEELGEKRHEIGSARSLVGFAVRLDSRISQNSRLVYATTGIVMRMLESSQNLDEVTHLILDEVHERECCSSGLDLSTDSEIRFYRERFPAHRSPQVVGKTTLPESSTHVCHC